MKATARRTSTGAPRSWIAPLLVFALLVVAYLPSLQGGFLWDDDEYVSRNETLTSLSGLAKIWFEPTASPQYYPLVFTSFWIEHHLWGLAPFGYKLVNLTLHAASAWVLWRLLASLRVPGAGVAASLFAIHPVAMESVAWITERKNCLSLLFYLIAARCWLAARDLAPFGSRSNARGIGAASGRVAEPDNSLARRGEPIKEPVGRRELLLNTAALLAFTLALLSKTVTATLPAALLLVRWWQTGRISRRDVYSLLPFFALGVGLGLHTAWLEKHHVGAQGTEWALGLVERMLLASRIPWFYASKLVIPYPIAFIYPRWTVDATAWVQWFFPLLTLGTLGALFFLRRRIGRGPLAATLFFFGTLMPALGFFDVFPMRYSWVADHFQYHAMIGVLVLIGAAIHRGIPAIEVSNRSRSLFPRGARPRAVVVVIPLMICAALVFARGPAYRDLESLWLDTISKNPGAWMAHHNLAQVYESGGRIPEALDKYSAALAIREDLPNTHYNLGSILAKQGRTIEALPHLERAIALEPTLPGALSNLANAYLVLGRSSDAIDRYREVLATDPANASARRNLAFALATAGDAAGAVREYRSIHASEPGDVHTAMRLAWVLATTDDPAVRDGKDAEHIAREAVRLTGRRDPFALQVLAAAQAENGRFQEAILLIQQAIELARSGNQPDRMRNLENQLERYRKGQPMRGE